MSILEDFYHIVGTVETDGEFRDTVRFNVGHPLYRVHFPGNPVTPGVVLLQIATQLLQKHIAQRLRLNTAASIKFKKPIAPDDVATFIFSKIAREDGRVCASVVIEVEQSQYVKMSLVYDTISR